MALSVGMTGIARKPVTLGNKAGSNPTASFDRNAVKPVIRELVRTTMENTINALLGGKADPFVKASPRHPRTFGQAPIAHWHDHPSSGETSR